MQKYERWKKNPARFLSMTGMNHEVFSHLLVYFEIAHDAYLKKFKMDGHPKRGGRSSILYANSPLPNHAERLCFVLYYLKHNPVQEAMADFYDMDQRQCNMFIHGLSVILERALERAEILPARTSKALEERLKSLDINELLHDATEREVPRPQDIEAQKENYSGKQKAHTIKNALITTMLGFVAFLSPTYAGKVHDKRIADEYNIPSGFTLWQDTGYQGYAPQGVLVVQPTKKPKGQELTEEQRLYNRSVSSCRVRIEHFIGGIKRFRIVKDECRAYKNGFRDRVMCICTGLYNHRITLNPPQYADNQLHQK